jgi:hypothetical protein
MAYKEMHPALLPLATEGSTAGIARGEDWKEILDAAVDHGLLWHLGHAEAVPAEVRDLVREQSLLVSARNLALAGELRRCLQALSGAGVDCAPVRGISLMERVYGEIVARPMGDIDLLVRRRETGALRNVLNSLGYREMDRRPGFSESFSYSLKFLVERAFTVVVEPHLTIAYPPASSRLDMDEIWARCVPTVVVGEPTLALCKEDLLLHLALHFAHRDQAPFVWLWELDRFIRSEDELDWGLFAATAREIEVQRIVGAVLTELESVFGTPIPADVSGPLLLAEGRQDRALAQVVAEHPGVREREGLAQLLALDGWGPKSHYVMALLMPTSEFMMQQYGLRSRFQLPWAYVCRAAGFGWEGVKGISRLIFSPPTEGGRGV